MKETEKILRLERNFSVFFKLIFFITFHADQTLLGNIVRLLCLGFCCGTDAGFETPATSPHEQCVAEQVITRRKLAA